MYLVYQFLLANFLKLYTIYMEIQPKQTYPTKHFNKKPLKSSEVIHKHPDREQEQVGNIAQVIVYSDNEL